MAYSSETGERFEIRAVAKFIRVQPRKVRIVANEIRGQMAQPMADVLRFHPSKGAAVLRKVLVSAIANAVENASLQPSELKIVRVQVDEGPKMKRMQARAMGRGNRIEKKMSHITVGVAPVEETEAPEVKTTKAKPRPTFAKPSKKASKKAAAEEAKPVEETKAEETPVEAPEAEAPAAEEETK